jgi:hypothetical protein
MGITIELPQGLQMQGEAYAKARGQSLATLFVSWLQESLANEIEPQKNVLPDGRTWEDVRDQIMTERAELWQRLAKL